MPKRGYLHSSNYDQPLVHNSELYISKARSGSKVDAVNASVHLTKSGFIIQLERLQKRKVNLFTFGEVGPCRLKLT